MKIKLYTIFTSKINTINFNKNLKFAIIIFKISYGCILALGRQNSNKGQRQNASLKNKIQEKQLKLQLDLREESYSK